ncbi:importin subunit alpha-9 isoform X5 [Raphanus sativus]|uniref:Importin subunit alpha-9 isoform X5 n=2 Tax=Raphanus sativus TaxID=3726 RepID=A0A6J0K675_RAPSA|nr:importin subunit alpha-9 isoform X5 [Raphanus sativus]
MQKRVIETALSAGAVPLLVPCLSFGLPDEQLLEPAWCLTNIAAGKPEETKALLPALPLLIAHLGEKSSAPVAEQCSWAIGNVTGEGEDLRNVLLSQGALPPLARMIFPDKGSTVRTAAWALSNLIKGPQSKAAAQLVRVDGIVDAILRHLKNRMKKFPWKLLGSLCTFLPSQISLQLQIACNFSSRFYEV